MVANENGSARTAVTCDMNGNMVATKTPELVVCISLAVSIQTLPSGRAARPSSVCHGSVTTRYDIGVFCIAESLELEGESARGSICW